MAVATSCPLNTEELLGRCLGKVELAQRVLDRFQKQLADDIPRLAHAVEKCEGAVIATVAHRIKGAAANVSAYGLRERAAALEDTARASDWDQIPIEVSLLASERDEFEAVWQQLAWSRP